MLRADVMRKVEALLAVRAAPAGSFDELDQAIDGCREAFEAWQRAVAPVSHNTPIAVDMRLAPIAIIYECGHVHADHVEAQRCWETLDEHMRAYHRGRP